MEMWCLYEPCRIIDPVYGDPTGETKLSLVMVDYVDRPDLDLLCFMLCPITGKYEGITVTDGGRPLF